MSWSKTQLFVFPCFSWAGDCRREEEDALESSYPSTKQSPAVCFSLFSMWCLMIKYFGNTCEDSFFSLSLQNLSAEFTTEEAPLCEETHDVVTGLELWGHVENPIHRSEIHLWPLRNNTLVHSRGSKKINKHIRKSEFRQTPMIGCSWISFGFVVT